MLRGIDFLITIDHFKTIYNNIPASPNDKYTYYSWATHHWYSLKEIEDLCDPH